MPLLLRWSVPESSESRMLYHRAGALGFHKFPGLPVAKENCNGSRRTLLLYPNKVA